MVQCTSETTLLYLKIKEANPNSFMPFEIFTAMPSLTILMEISDNYFFKFSVNFVSYNLIAMSSSDDNEYGSFSNCCLRIFMAQIISLFNSSFFI